MEFISTDAATMSPIGLFLQADWVVRAVMIGLLLASLWTWAIILSFGFKVSAVKKAIDRFEAEYREADDIDEFHRRAAGRDQPIARVFAAGVTEWRRSTSGKAIDREGTRERLATAMGATIAQEIDKLADRLNFLATVGSVAPFVGLFGTVWASCAASPVSPRSRAHRSPWSRRASPRRCSPRRSACSPPFRR